MRQAGVGSRGEAILEEERDPEMDAKLMSGVGAQSVRFNSGRFKSSVHGRRMSNNEINLSVANASKVGSPSVGRRMSNNEINLSVANASKVGSRSECGSVFHDFRGLGTGLGEKSPWNFVGLD